MTLGMRHHVSQFVLSLWILFTMGCEPIRDSDAVESGNSDAETAWRPLFDGRTLAGWWNPYDWGEAWVEDGEIHLRGDEKFFLVTDDTFDDFVLEAEIRMPDTESNSGFMFRAQVAGNEVIGYQAEVDPSERAWSGGLYDEGRRGWLNPDREDPQSVEAFRSTAGEAFSVDDWNRYQIRAEGDSIWIRVNGQLTTVFADTVDSDGYIGLQHHGEAGKVYRFRNVRVRALDGEVRF